MEARCRRCSRSKRTQLDSDKKPCFLFLNSNQRPPPASLSTSCLFLKEVGKKRERNEESERAANESRVT
jgi:hypothetical protein